MPEHPSNYRLGAFTTNELADYFATHKTSALLLPVGSIEPHGPHLPLETDALIGEEVARRAAMQLTNQTIPTLIAPTLPLGVTDFATGFAGAWSIDASILSAFVRNAVETAIKIGFSHVCIINNHLEPEQDMALRAAIENIELYRASIACPLIRRWGRTLSDEFKSGACHAGRYETSLLLAASPHWVHRAVLPTLPKVAISLSEEIHAGKKSFLQMGMNQAYTGDPAAASPEEGHNLLEKLTDMVVSIVSENMAQLVEGNR